MAKFCTQCGKELNDKEVCDCKKEKDTKTKETKSYQNIIIDFVIKPFDVSKDYLKKQDTNRSWAIIGVISMIISFFAVEIMACSFQGTHYLLGNYPYFRNFIIYTFLFMATFLFFNILIQAFTKWILKRDLTFYRLLDVMAVSLIPLGYTSLLSLLSFYIFGMSFPILLILGGIFSSIMYFYNIKYIGDLEENKFIYIFLLATSIIGILWLV